MSTPAVAFAAGRGTRRHAVLVTGYAVLLGLCAVLSLVWLAAGAVVGVATYVPPVAEHLAAAAARGNRWAQGVLAAVPHSEPAAQMVLDYGFSVLSIAIALAMLLVPDRSWSVRLLALAMVGSAGAFNLQAHAAATAVQVASGLTIGGLHQVLLHGVACAAYVLALLMFPPDRETGRTGRARTALAAAGAGSLVLVGIGTALLPHTTSCVLFFGFLVPLVGLGALPRQIRGAPTAAARTQARLLFSVLAAAFAVTVVLAVVTVVLWSMGWRGVVLVDPTAAGGPYADEPTALVFWFARLACIAIAGAVLVATLGGGLWTAERLFSRGLVAAFTAAVVGGGFIVTRAGAGPVLGTRDAAVLATAVAALALLPVYVRAEWLADRLLYGTRPTPYSALAGVAALSRVTETDAPDLARVAEAVGRGLGATTCRLTVARPGLRDRSYTWAEPGAHDSDELVEVAVQHGAERIGTVAVDHAAVAGLHRQRQHLLEDIADSLGAVLQATRSGIELERQLRAALAHAHEIAASRRAVVAEMDAERRRIERDLHDGAQHHLVSLRLTLGLVEHQVATGQFDQARCRLEQIADQIDAAESILAETATGVSSPLLAETGLVGALETELGRGQPPVAVDSDGIAAGQRFPRDVEAAVYFCCLEAVNNARKHAEGAAIGVRLGVDGGCLRFTVHDDGPGWDPAGSSGSDGPGPDGSPGRGLRNVTARVTALGGRIEIWSGPGTGTTVEGTVPLPQFPAVAAVLPQFPVEPVALPQRPAEPAAVAPPAVALPLVDQVRAAVRTAREIYHGTPQAGPLRELAQRLDEPLRVAVAGAAESGHTVLAEALAALEKEGEDGPPARAVPVDLPHRPLSTLPALTAPADAFVLVLRDGHPGDVTLHAGLQRGTAPLRPAHAIGVLAVVEEPDQEPDQEPAAQRTCAELAARPDVRRLCHAVVAVAPRLARAAQQLTDDAFRDLQARAEDGSTAGAEPGEAPDEADGPGCRTPVAATAVSAFGGGAIDGTRGGSAGGGRATGGGGTGGGGKGGGGTGGGAAIGGATSGGATVGGATGGGARVGGARVGGARVGGATVGGATSGGARAGGATVGGARVGGAMGGGAAGAGSTSGGATAGGGSSLLRPVSTGPAGSAPGRAANGGSVSPRRARSHRLGAADVRIALDAIRSGRARSRDELAALLLHRSGLPALRELIRSRFACRADALVARSALHALETVTRTNPPRRPATPLLYQLDRIRSAAPELAEIDLVDALRAGELRLPDDDRADAERLLGAAGFDPRTRLGLPSDATADEVAAAAADQLARWRMREVRPGSGGDARKVAGLLVPTCERLLAGATDR